MNKTNAAQEHADHKLIELINQKDESAFNVLYDQYWNRLLSFAGHYIPDTDTCQEVVQELFITLHQKRLQLNVSSSISAYLYSSLRNRIYNYLRDRSVYNKHIKGAARTRWMSAVDNMEQRLDLLELNKIIDDCLITLPERYREVYVLHRQYGYTLKKTSALLKRPVDTVEKQYRRVMQLLRRHLCTREEYSPKSYLPQ